MYGSYPAPYPAIPSVATYPQSSPAHSKTFQTHAPRDDPHPQWIRAALRVVDYDWPIRLPAPCPKENSVVALANGVLQADCLQPIAKPYRTSLAAAPCHAARSTNVQ